LKIDFFQKQTMDGSLIYIERVVWNYKRYVTFDFSLNHNLKLFGAAGSNNPDRDFMLLSLAVGPTCQIHHFPQHFFCSLLLTDLVPVREISACLALTAALRRTVSRQEVGVELRCWAKARLPPQRRLLRRAARIAPARAT
jgi:hypothetical protein